MAGRRCGCGTVTWADAPAGVTAPVQYGPRAAAIAAYLWHGQFLSRARTGQAMADLFGIAPSPGAIASMARRIADAAARAVEAVRGALAAAPVAHFDETGFRVAGRLAWVHSASSGKYALVTVHEKRGRDGMDAAGVLPGFGGIACHDAWAPYDCYDCGGHALCCAHVLRELTAVTETGTDRDVTWARQAIEALLALKKAADAARADGLAAISEETLDEHSRWFREAASAGIMLNAGRRTALQKKRHALASRLAAREADYLRFASDLRVPFDNNEAERVIRMSKLRIKVSGCMRSMKGADLDEGSRYVTEQNNVVQDAGVWAFTNADANNNTDANTFSGNWYNGGATEVATGSPHYNVLNGNVLVSGYNWPSVAEQVISQAGIQSPAGAVPPAGQIISVDNTAKCVDDNGLSSANGTKIQIWDCNGQANQQWTTQPNGTIQVYGKCMDITGANYGNGTLIELWTCNGGGNQQWQAVNGQLVNPASGKCLDIPNSNTTNGTQLEIWTCNGGSNQQWLIP